MTEEQPHVLRAAEYRSAADNRPNWFMDDIQPAEPDRATEELGGWP